MSVLSVCPRCAKSNVYPDGALIVCADCGHEWTLRAGLDDGEDEDDLVIKDVNGSTLKSGDSVVLIKDLRVKGSSITLKMGTKVKSIRLVDGDHEVDCRTDSGNFMLKACYLRKV
ncbi:MULTISPECIES: zinc ribbon domain-containing protein YjdM [unclassified Burkholderia]|uniref:zinc ribbon domain-containing protein YjdM n=1 Tax=unclassified Burkholderia TaxID=2613784 RepID=UPI001423D780|nr:MULTISPECIES: zinc ribbon domain-containing protein YjdM [unclassified Burkholderia]NIE82384.1 alkylphosphonate utilization protein [Burkholderia sp. Tr-860]NIF61275.1 alkylphosphonate utilization protein [Burkholderia sp. Cy-647]NIF96192.1 alkylphosphonate utilization protein [Burkholderia sp. Ax-1720]